jgi:transglutaminase/protease-like cytokinesis protein 3
MKKRHLLLLWVLIVSNSVVFSQNYQDVDSIVRNYPNEFYNTKDLANLITKDFIEQDEKARAIYTWIALNIKYDLQVLINPPDINNYLKKTDEEKEEFKKHIKDGIAAYLLRKGKGICYEYATLFKELCKLVELDCQIVRGAGKTGILNLDSIPNYINHSWNAVKIGNKWKLVDVTWASGYYDEKSKNIIHNFNDFFFFTPPKIFAQSHFPVDPKWLLTTKTKNSFDESPILYDTYFQRNLRIKKPKKGIISKGRNDIIKFVIINSGNDSISFKFGNEMSIRNTVPKINNEVYVYEIDYRYTNDTFLTLYVGEKRLARYLITK